MHPSATHPAAISGEKLLAECEMRLLRRSGPGGQHRNKVETAVVLLHVPSGVSAEANERRSQAENRREALFRLRVNLALKVRGAAPLVAFPTSLWSSRRGNQGRIAVADEHDDFPALLAEALDVIALCDDDVARAADTLGVTPSQLTKLLKKEPRALAQLNAHRRQRGLHPLR
ncbi:MAG TPA: peptide chain release factor-like protein [Planctomycetaceae bacterium]|nr:peptide chain release factor-like protein [Planctomycetaceae bacterium]